MPYISQEKATAILNELKSKFPAFKFRKRVRDHSTLEIVITAGPIDLGREIFGEAEKHYSYGINVYWIADHFRHQPEVSEFLQEVHKIMNSSNGILVVDGDYGSVPNYYTSIVVEDYKIIKEQPIQQSSNTTTMQQAQTNTTGVKINFNEKLGGIEISFSSKPAQKVIDQLKNDGFRWSKFNKVWWIKDNSTTRARAAKYGQLPEDNQSDAPDSFDMEQEDIAARSIGLM